MTGRIEYRTRRNPDRRAQRRAGSDQASLLHLRAARHSSHHCRRQQDRSCRLSESAFDRIVDDYLTFASELGFSSIVPIPISARFGDNIADLSAKTPWYRDRPLLEHIETMDVLSETSDAPFRFPVQLVNRPNQDFRGYAGTVASGQIRKGDPIVVASTGLSSRIEEIVTYDGPMEVAACGAAVTLTLKDEINIGRGDVLTAPIQGRRSPSNLPPTYCGWIRCRCFQAGRTSYELGRGPFRQASRPSSIKSTSIRGSIWPQILLHSTISGFATSPARRRSLLMRILKSADWVFHYH